MSDKANYSGLGRFLKSIKRSALAVRHFGNKAEDAAYDFQYAGEFFESLEDKTIIANQNKSGGTVAVGLIETGKIDCEGDILTLSAFKLSGDPSKCDHARSKWTHIPGGIFCRCGAIISNTLKSDGRY